MRKLDKMGDSFSFFFFLLHLGKCGVRFNEFYLQTYGLSVPYIIKLSSGNNFCELQWRLH